MNELMTAGIELMLLGMGIVYAFLAMLVVMIGWMSSLINRFFPEMPASHLSKTPTGQDPGVIAAIAAAVQHYRQKHPTNE